MSATPRCSSLPLSTGCSTCRSPSTRRSPTPDAGAALAWSTPVGERHQPRLRLEELTGLIGAFAVGGRIMLRGAGWRGGSPAPAHQRLDRGRAGPGRAAGRAGVRGTAGLDDVATRIGFFEQATSAALVEVARRRDAANQSMWRTLAEAKALAVSWRRAPRRWVLRSPPWSTGGTNRSTQDDLVISLVRSNAELEQTGATSDALRRSAARLDALRSLGGGSDVPTTALLAAGARRAPSLPTSERWPLPADRSGWTPSLTRHLGPGAARRPRAGTGPSLVPELAALPRGRAPTPDSSGPRSSFRALFATRRRGCSRSSAAAYPGSGYRRPTACWSSSATIPAPEVPRSTSC